MPTYEYQCKSCGHQLEEFQSFTEPPLTRCPSCDTDNLVRVIGSRVGLIFKGTGFYRTDYKKGALKHEDRSPEKSAPKKDSSPPQGGPSSDSSKK